jgi:hypothetical protein
VAEFDLNLVALTFTLPKVASSGGCFTWRKTVAVAGETIQFPHLCMSLENIADQHCRVTRLSGFGELIGENTSHISN